MKGMVLAAGYGTRFRPATYETPKPMVPVCNRPLISYAVDSLLAAGVDEVVVNLHHRPEQIESFLRSSYEGKCRLVFSFESEILGTGGGVRKARPFLEGDEAFFLVNGDTIQRPPLRKLLQVLSETRSVAALLLRRAPADDRFTPVMFDGRFVTGFGGGPGKALMFAGAHALSRRIFDFIPDRDVSGLTEDVYAPVIEAGKETIAGLIHEDLWFDIGTPLRYLSASMQMLRLLQDGSLPLPPDSRVEKDCRVLAGLDSELQGDLQDVVLGRRCRVRKAARVRDSVLWNQVEIGANAFIRNAVLAHDVRVPQGGRIENVLVCRALPEVDYDERTLTRRGELVAAAIDPHHPITLEFNGL